MTYSRDWQYKARSIGEAIPYGLKLLRTVIFMDLMVYGAVIW